MVAQNLLTPSLNGRSVMQKRPGTYLALAAVLFGAILSNSGSIEAEDATPEPTAVLNVWTQFGPDGGLSARARVNGGCPEITIDGQALAMTIRSGPFAAFTDTVCEAAVPIDAKQAEIDGTGLALVPAKLDDLSIIGDTGCRIAGKRLQDCSDPTQWTYAAVIKSALANDPDIAIHVGDYIYRESACAVTSFAWCEGAPFGDTTATWEADFFIPSGPYLAGTPWIFLRGNHELCEREGTGWFRYLASGPMPAACSDYSDPYTLTILGKRFLVLDSAAIGDTKTTPELNDEFASQFLELRNMAEPGDWLLTHKPIAGGILDLGNGEQFVTYATIKAVADGRVPDDLAVVISGHIHLGQVLVFEEGTDYPLQIVVGNSGTSLDKGETGTYSGEILGAADIVDHATVMKDFGWLNLKLDGDRFTATFIDLEGEATATLFLPMPR